MEQKKSTKYILIAISVLFIFVMLILPLFSILFSALKKDLLFTYRRSQPNMCVRLFWLHCLQL